jgi:hypothetical protein
VGLAINATDADAFEPRDPEEVPKVNQDCVDVAVQFNVDPLGPVFLITSD